MLQKNTFDLFLFEIFNPYLFFQLAVISCNFILFKLISYLKIKQMIHFNVYQENFDNFNS